MKKLLFLVFLVGLTAQARVYRVQTIKNGNKEEIVNIKSNKSISGVSIKRKLFSMPLYIPEGAPASKEIFEEYLVSEDQLTQSQKTFLTKKDIKNLEAFPLGTEVRTLISQGPSDNRIDLTILGDGYTEAEKEKFFKDAFRTYQGLFDGKTFAHYQPLFNIHAVFVPSLESGLGDGSPKNTAFQLYRSPKGSKRAIMPGNTFALESAVRLAPDTDFPIVIANDDYYGGLGGRYAISTRSVRSGLIVLRHELGHNFGQVGEEYDNGYVYRGANSSNYANASSWAHWSGGKVQSFESSLLTGDYVWQNLAEAPYSAEFEIPQEHSVVTADISAVGWESPDDVSIRLDGKTLPVSGNYHDDRSFFLFGPVTGLSSGSHRLDISESKHDGDNVLGFAVVHSYPSDYDFTPNRIGAFSTFDDQGRKTYRPTHSSCLMRDMLVENFCSVDQENIWHQFLNRVDIIDKVEVSKAGANITAKVVGPALKDLSYSWYRLERGREIAVAENTSDATKTLAAGSKYRVKVHFTNSDVRKESDRFYSQKDFE